MGKGILTSGGGQKQPDLSGYAKKEEVTSAVNNHNSNASAHQSIRDSITSAVNSHNTNASAHANLVPNKAKMADRLTGIEGTPGSDTWGIQTGTLAATGSAANDSAYQWRYNCPGTGQLSLKVDGEFYAAEGAKRCYHEGDLGGLAFMDPPFDLGGANVSGVLPVSKGGTGATSVDAARNALNAQVKGNYAIIGGDGVTDIGQYLDFKVKQADYDVRLIVNDYQGSGGTYGCLEIKMYGSNSNLNQFASYNFWLSPTTFAPAETEKEQLGDANYLWRDIYSASGAINTSDRKEKIEIEPLVDKYEQLFNLLKPVSYKFIDGTSGRTHTGFISQDVEEALAEVGLTALDFAGFCKDVKTERKEVKTTDPETGEEIVEKREEPITDEDGNPEYHYALRYSEFIALNTHMIQCQQRKIEELEARIKALEEAARGTGNL